MRGKTDHLFGPNHTGTTIEEQIADWRFRLGDSGDQPS
jgi:hypothetical protein